MIYKFKDENVGAYLEVQRDESSVKMTMFDKDDIFVMEISKDTLYDFIGALHSIQSKIKKDDNFDKLSNSF